MQLDESTIADNNALLMAHVRHLNKNNTLHAEMLFTLNLNTDITGLSIFTAVKLCFAIHNIPFSNVGCLCNWRCSIDN
jgi:hypothetical protein